MYLTFSGMTIEGVFDTLNMNYTFVYQEKSPRKLIDLIRDLFTYIEENQVESSINHFDLSAKLYHFIMQLKKNRTVNNCIPQRAAFDKLKPNLEWLEQVYSENIGLLEISEQANMSSQHLNTLFNKTFSLSPYAFLVKLRIREAMRLLLTDTEMTMSEVTNLVGFNSVSHFISTFKQHEKKTPKQYQELNK